jgi:hypothetical protein
MHVQQNIKHSGHVHSICKYHVLSYFRNLMAGCRDTQITFKNIFCYFLRRVPKLNVWNKMERIFRRSVDERVKNECIGSSNGHITADYLGTALQDSHAVCFSYFTFMWPCIVTDSLIIKPTRCTNSSNLFWNETQHVSDNSSVHQLSNGICHTDSLRVGSGWNSITSWWAASVV